MSEHKTLELPSGAPAVRAFMFRARDVRCVHIIFYLRPPLFENPGSAPDSEKRYIK